MPCLLRFFYHSMLKCFYQYNVSFFPRKSELKHSLLMYILQGKSPRQRLFSHIYPLNASKPHGISLFQLLCGFPLFRYALPLLRYYLPLLRYASKLLRYPFPLLRCGFTQLRFAPKLCLRPYRRERDLFRPGVRPERRSFCQYRRERLPNRSCRKPNGSERIRNGSRGYVRISRQRRELCCRIRLRSCGKQFNKWQRAFWFNRLAVVSGNRAFSPARLSC